MSQSHWQLAAGSWQLAALLHFVAQPPPLGRVIPDAFVGWKKS
jgi:hypothetical protein